MSNTVFILGAGVSAGAGAPLMNDFLDKAEHLMLEGVLGEDDPIFRLAFKAIAQLQSVHAKSTLDLENIESIYVAFEMAQLLNKLPNMEEDVEKLDHAIKRVIVRTLQESVPFQILNDTEIKSWHVMSNFVKFIDLMMQRSENISLLTFNYDCIADIAFAQQGVEIKYCLDDSPQTGVPFLKLHGSLHWEAEDEKITCPIDFNSLNIVGTSRPIEARLIRNNDYHLYYKINTPCIVPPTLSKLQHHNELQSVWRTASSRLSTADNIVILGYSLPPSDLFFRYFFALASLGHHRVKNFFVVDAYPNQGLFNRYSSMLGPEIKRSRFSMHQSTFEAFVARLSNHCGNAMSMTEALEIYKRDWRKYEIQS